MPMEADSTAIDLLKIFVPRRRRIEPAEGRRGRQFSVSCDFESLFS